MTGIEPFLCPADTSYFILLECKLPEENNSVLLFTDSLVPRTVPATKKYGFSKYLLNKYIPILQMRKLKIRKTVMDVGAQNH